jgi:hypothetical protein
MTDLLAARTQMAISLGFHIVFAEIGVAMPLMMVLAEWRWRRTGDAAYLELAKRWAKGTAILFAVGAVSGTVLSFELGLLWPGFMRFAGPIIGLPFSLEGFAFFTEAIFLGVYLYGWNRVSPRAHMTAGAIVAASGAASALFVVEAGWWGSTRSPACRIPPRRSRCCTCCSPRTPPPASPSRECTPGCCYVAETRTFTGARSPSRCSSVRRQRCCSPSRETTARGSSR